MKPKHGAEEKFNKGIKLFHPYFLFRPPPIFKVINKIRWGTLTNYIGTLTILRHCGIFIELVQATSFCWKINFVVTAM